MPTYKRSLVCASLELRFRSADYISLGAWFVCEAGVLPDRRPALGRTAFRYKYLLEAISALAQSPLALAVRPHWMAMDAARSFYRGFRSYQGRMIERAGFGADFLLHELELYADDTRVFVVRPRDQATVTDDFLSKVLLRGGMTPRSRCGRLMRYLSRPTGRVCLLLPRDGGYVDYFCYRAGELGAETVRPCVNPRSGRHARELDEALLALTSRGRTSLAGERLALTPGYPRFQA